MYVLATLLSNVEGMAFTVEEQQWVIDSNHLDYNFMYSEHYEGMQQQYVYRTMQNFGREILTNLTNSLQFVKILPFKFLFCLHVRLIQFVKIFHHQSFALYGTLCVLY